VWQGLRAHRGWWWVTGGAVALALYGVAATRQPSDDFGRVLAAYGGIFVAGSLAWGWAADGYRPDRFDVISALICLAGMAVIISVLRGR
jgi:small multidrug resistance family-3 protein